MMGGLLVTLTLVLAQADQEEARIGPKLARDLSFLSGPRYYWGNSYSGFSQLKKAGWKPFDGQMPSRSGIFF